MSNTTPPKHQRGWCYWSALTLALLSGCASSTYRADTLPPQLQAPPVQNVNKVDLSKLSGFAVSNQLIEPGDVLEITLVSGFNDKGAITTPVRVNDDGSANVPLIGAVQLAGFELEGAERAIYAAARSRGIFQNPHVTVVMERKRMNKVTVVGAVNKPGLYEIPRGASDLLAAIVAAGGLADDAGIDVEVRSPARHIMAPMQSPPGDVTAGRAPGQQVNYQQQPQYVPPRSMRVNLVSASTSNQGGVRLGDGDVVMVVKRDPKPVHVLGLVKKPGQYEMPSNQELRVLDAIAMAGGVNSNVANKVFVIRRVPGQDEAAVVRIGLDEAKRKGGHNLRLASGDIVTVEQTAATIFYDALKSFMRFGFSSSVAVF